MIYRPSASEGEDVVAASSARGMAAESPPPAVTDPDAVLRFRARLDDLGYTEPLVCQRLSVPACLPFSRRKRSLALFLHRTSRVSPLDVLVRLFHLGCPVPLDDVRSSMTPAALREAVGMRLIEIQGQTARAAVELVPYERLVVAADWPGAAAAGSSQVMGITASTRALADIALWSSAGKTLDLGTGSGVLAFMAARYGSRVTAVDCNARAIQFAKFNALLNRSPDIAWRVGDFFETSPARYDLIVCNPPFVIAPDVGFLHSHSGQPGDQLCSRLVRAAPTRLTEGGYFQISINWAVLAGQPWPERLAAWFQGTHCDALLVYSHLEDAAEYALDRVHEMTDDESAAAAAFDRWVTCYAREGIEAIGFGILTLRRSTREDSWFDCRRLRPGEPATRTLVHQTFARRDFLRSHASEASLLGARLRAADQVVCDQKLALASGNWRLVDSRLAGAAGPSATPACAEVIELVSWCGAGERPVGEFLLRLGRRSSQPAAEFAQTVRRLIEVGLLEPVVAE